MMSRIFAAALALMLAVSAIPALADEIDKDVPIETATALTPLGVKATVATVRAETPGTKETVLVFTTFDKPYVGELQVRGFRSDGVEVARSALKQVNYRANEGGNIAFEFDKHTTFKEVKRFTLTGQLRAPSKKEESLGDKISNTAKEIFQ